ncbi:MAG: phosphotransferase [Alphaproteobacteria bacterium]|nr:MAG: phosphotransferase [Alphaproteobacteria bacterium]
MISAPAHLQAIRDLPHEVGNILGRLGLVTDAVLMAQGTINDVYLLGDPARSAACVLRLRSRAHVFQYEQGLVKEPIVAALLVAHEREGRILGASDFRVDDRLMPSDGPMACSLWGDIFAYECAPHTAMPWLLMGHVEGEHLTRRPDASAYHLLGEALARLHRPVFDAVYADFYADPAKACDMRAHLHDLMVDGLRRWRCGAEGAHRPDIQPALQDLITRPGFFDDSMPVLVHNDIQPTNVILERDGPARLIDWDNAVIGCAERDFAKLRAWTRLDAQGWLCADADLFQACLDGYLAAGGRPLNSDRLDFHSLIWLSRIIPFEQTRPRPADARPFPHAQAYEGLLNVYCGRHG